jgi:hypothetical protein
MSKCDDLEVAIAFKTYVELYLDKDVNRNNTATEQKAKKASQSNKSNFTKVIEYCMSILSVDEKAIRHTKQPKDRAERAVWAEKLMTLSKNVHLKLMSHLELKEAEMRKKHSIAKLSTSGKKKPLLSTVVNLARRTSALKTMEKKKVGEFKIGNDLVNIVSYSLNVIFTTPILIYDNLH